MNSFVKVSLRFFAFVADLIPSGSQPKRRVDYSTFYRPHDPHYQTQDLALKRLWSEISRLSLRRYLFYLCRVNSFLNDDWWSSIQAQTTILHGTHDTFAPYHLAAELASQIRGAHLVTINGANHILVINNIPEIIELIRSNGSS